MLGLLFGCGLRRSEAVALELADYAAGAVKVRAGKGRKERMVYPPGGARHAIEAWIALRGDWQGALLTPVLKGGHIQLRHLTDQAVMLRLRFLAQRAGISHLSPHDLRRTFVGELLDAGVDMATVQKLAGHADPATTSRYDRRPEDSEAPRIRAADRPLRGAARTAAAAHAQGRRGLTSLLQESTTTPPGVLPPPGGFFLPAGHPRRSRRARAPLTAPSLWNGRSERSARGKWYPTIT